MIVGVGVDLCPVSRMRQALSRHDGRFALRVFTAEERDYCQARAEPAQHYAARFAAKEAFLKALAVPPGLSWHEIAVLSDGNGPPRLQLSGQAAQAAQARGASHFHLSMTHAGDSAMAVVIAEQRPSRGGFPSDGGL